MTCSNGGYRKVRPFAFHSFAFATRVVKSASAVPCVDDSGTRMKPPVSVAKMCVNPRAPFTRDCRGPGPLGFGGEPRPFALIETRPSPTGRTAVGYQPVGIRP